MKKLFFLLTTLTLLLFNNNAFADHVLGTDLQWKCLGNDTFKIILKFYRDCRGIPKVGTASLTFASDSCASSYTGTVNCSRVSLKDVTPVCNKLCNPANTMLPSLPYGIEEHIFEGNVYLGGNYANCCWYKFTFTECCRSGNINTGYTWANFSTELWLNRCITPCDNGPEFKNPPITVISSGQDVFYNNGVFDADGDSLVYKKALPNGAVYTSPWSVNYPLTCFGGPYVIPDANASPPVGFNLDSITGDIIFRPTVQQESVIKIKVEEWRKINGVYKIIGIVSRDLQVIIINAADKTPHLSGAFVYDACLGQQLCININTSDSDASDTTRIYLNNSLPASTWSDNNGTVKNASGVFCWTPTDSNAINRPFYFSVTVKDDHCQLQGTSTRTYSITVRTTPKNTRAFTKINCTSWEFKAIPAGNSSPTATYQWYVPKLLGTGTPTVLYSSTNPVQFQFFQSGTYLVKSIMSNGGCGTRTDIDTLWVDSNRTLNITTGSFTNLCVGDSALLTADSSSNYQWYDDTTQIAGATSRIYVAKKAGKYFVTNNNLVCLTSSNTITITETSKLPIIKSGAACLGDNVTYKTPGITNATYQWYRNGTLIPGAFNDSCIVNQDGIYYCLVKQLKCASQTFTDTLSFLPLPAKPTISRSNTTLTSSHGFSYQWYLSNSPVNGATDSFYVVTLSGNYKVKITGANGCFIYSDPFNFVGIAENALSAKIKISPNPFHNKLSIETKDFDKPVSISLYDMEGKLILKQNITTRGIASLNTSSLSNGIYLLEVNDGENKATYKVEKQ